MRARFKLDFNAINRRTKEVEKKLNNELENNKKNSDINRDFDEFSREDPEEGLFYLLLLTHFGGEQESSKELISKISWNYLKNNSKTRWNQKFNDFFSKVRIGDHRRNFRCMSEKERTKYTIELFESYKDVVQKYGSQSLFFEINEKSNFDNLYVKMKQIKGFKTRLPRWDHLEKLSRIHNFYLRPTRFYAENSTGPLDGLTFLFFNDKYRKMKKIKRDKFRKYLTKEFPEEWNSKVEDEYKIKTQPNSWKEIIPYLEKWIIEKIRLRVPTDKRTVYVFDLESSLCNWQKRKKIPCS